MLADKNKLESANVRNVLRRSKRVKVTGFTVYVQYAAGSVSQAAFIAPKKVTRTGVARNLIRRRLAHILREWVAVNNAGYRVIVYVEPGFETLTWVEIRDSITTALNKVTR